MVRKLQNQTVLLDKTLYKQSSSSKAELTFQVMHLMHARANVSARIMRPCARAK